MIAYAIKSGCVVILLFIMTLLFSCSDNSTEAEDVNPIIGTWDVSKMTSIYEGVTETYDSDQLAQMELVWTLKFQEDSTAEQITNISGPLLSMPGTWLTSDNQLTLALLGPTGTIGTIVYEYIVNADLLKLNWQMPNGRLNTAEFTKQ